MLGAVLGTIKKIWDILNAPNNDPIIVSLVIGWGAFLFSFLMVWLSYRARLIDKDKEINRLVDERNKWQEFFFEERGAKRLTTKPPSTRKEEE